MLFSPPVEAEQDGHNGSPSARQKGAAVLHANRRTRRQWTSLADAQWKHAVLRRDLYTCRFPGCDANTNLDAAHIIARRFLASRWEVQNGLTLCRRHHELMHAQPTAFWDAMRADRMTP